MVTLRQCHVTGQVVYPKIPPLSDCHEVCSDALIKGLGSCDTRWEMLQGAVYSVFPSKCIIWPVCVLSVTKCMDIDVLSVKNWLCAESYFVIFFVLQVNCAKFPANLHTK